MTVFELPEDQLYLYYACQNLVYGLNLLNDTVSQSLAKQVQGYLYPIPTKFPCICLYPGTRLTVKDNRQGYDGQDYQIVVRYYIGKLGEKFDGKLQADLWKFLPLMVNYVNKHPDLVFSDTQADDDGEQVGHIPELLSEGSRARQLTRLGIFRDDPVHIGLEIGIDLQFDVETDEQFFVDDSI
jgi:hypothetical protein